MTGTKYWGGLFTL
uniref:Uncharacterized protein n=1 Tax=Anguilla anguilla TaxID=7936 RepID=A0A0E9TDT1_ANGAN